MIKKLTIFAVLALMLSGCGASTNIDELISAKELPEYDTTVEIEINDDETGETEPINIDE